MKISVIVPTWGCEPWLAACRASVRAAEAALKAACAPVVLEVLEVSNGAGAAAARNEGLARATGDWFVFVDGDDVIAPEFFVEVARQAADADLIRFRLATFSGDEDFRMNPPRRPFPFCWTACAYHRRVVPKSGFNPFVCGEDALFLLDCLVTAKRLVDVDRIVYGYRLREGSATSSAPSLKRMHDRLSYGLDWLGAVREKGPGAHWRDASFLNEVSRARQLVVRDVMGSLAIETRLMHPPPWALWHEALARLLATGELPLKEAALARICKTLKWPLLARLVRK